MKVITSNPVIIDGNNLSNDELYSYDDDFYSNGNGDEITPAEPTEGTGMSASAKDAFLQSGQAVVGGLVTALATKPKRPLSEVEQRCGKKPKVGKKKKAEWQKCANSASAPQMPVQPIPAPTADDTKKPMSKGLKIGLIAGSVVLVAIIGFVIYKKSKK